MKIYVVGGAVRDEMLGLPVKDHDYVVVGATPQEMLALGFTPVGRDFPVFLHPDTHEEYALARTERKTAPGYHGFTFHAAADVTLEQDLQRRDLTINAMARDEEGRLIDPFGGAEDLGEGILRHVSAAFVEDPVRILRAARFAARFGFAIAPETGVLMTQMVDAGEADALVPERVWQELAKGLQEQSPSVMLQVLEDCGALARVVPPLAALFSSGEAAEALMALDATAQAHGTLDVRFAALLQGVEPEAVDALCTRLKAPAACRDLALLAARHGNALADGDGLEAPEVLALLDVCDAWRRPDRFRDLCTAVLAGKPGAQKVRLRLQGALDAGLAVDAGAIARSNGGGGEQIREAVAQARLEAVAAALQKT